MSKTAQEALNNSPPAAAAPAARPFWKNVVAGGGAGILEIMCMYPTDVAKTRQQLMGGKTVSMVGIWKDIVATEGAANLYRGVLSPVLAEAPKRAMKFGLNETYKGYLRLEDGSLPAYRAAMAGSLAGMSECSVNTPFEMVKVQMQSKENIGRFTSVGQCVVTLVKEEGPLVLYKGLEPQLWRNAAWNGVYFGMIGWLKGDVLPPPPDASTATKRGYDFVGGCIGGVLATVANTPFDVVKSRMQGGLAKYQWTLPSLATVAREEGTGALYKGLGPRLVRLGPGGGIMLVAFNGIIDLLEDY